MIDSLLCSTWSAILMLMSGIEIGIAIESIANRKYGRAGISAMFGAYFALYAAKVMFCW